MQWPERVLQILHMAGVSQDAYEPLEWKFDNRAQAGIMRHRSQARPLPNEVYGGPLSLGIGFHWTYANELRAAETRASVFRRQLRVCSGASWHMGLEARMLDMQTVTKLDASSRKYARRAASMRVGSS